MKQEIENFMATIENDLIRFTQDIIRIRSYTGEEEELAMFVKDKMIELGYDDVIIDKLGNVIGVIGNGETKVLYDSHIDTVEVNDAQEWSIDPFGGEIKDGKIYGRGAVDMKSAVAATVYAGYAIKQLGLDEGKTIYISASIMEEDYDGEAVTYLMNENDIRPDYVIVCEPSQLKLGIGHRGRALLKITTEGVSAHGSIPEKGDNAIYKMNTIISRVEELSKKFIAMTGDKGSISITKIESESVSLNAIPHLCSMYLDRRLELWENEKFIEIEMETLVEGTDAEWEIFDTLGTSWRGEKVVLHSFFPAWEMERDHELVLACVDTFKQLQGKNLDIIKLGFSTNGVATAGKFGIPTLVFGPGSGKLAHVTDENCPVVEIIDACKFYTLLPHNLE